MHQGFAKRFVCIVCTLSIFICAAAPSALAAGGEGGETSSLSAADVRSMQQADEAVSELTGSDEYEAMSRSAREEAALAGLEELAAEGLVREDSVYVNEGSGMISFTYACGVQGGILLEEPDENSAETFAVPLGENATDEQIAASLNAAISGGDDEENGLLEQLGSRREFLGNAMIYYAFDDLINSTRYPYYAYMQAFWTTMGFTTQLNTSVTVSDLRRMGDYDLCILSAHGSYYTYGGGYFATDLRTEPVILLLEESTMLKDFMYGFDLLAHRVIKVNGRYCVTPEFFANTYQSGQLSNTIILSETCEFLGVSNNEDSSMAEAFLAGGAKAVLGYVNNVYAVYSRSMLWDIVNHLIVGDTLRESLDHACGLYGTDDLIWYNQRGGQRPHALASYAVIYGNETARLYTPAVAAAA